MCSPQAVRRADADVTKRRLRLAAAAGARAYAQQEPHKRHCPTCGSPQRYSLSPPFRPHLSAPQASSHVFFMGSYDELQEGRAGRACKGCGVAYDLVAGRGGAPSDGGAALWFNPTLQARPSGSGSIHYYFIKKNT